MITLSGQEIKELAEFAGFHISSDMFGDDDLETEYDIYDCPKNGVLGDDGKSRYYRYIAILSEYPEEGTMPLGDEIRNREA